MIVEKKIKEYGNTIHDLNNILYQKKAKTGEIIKDLNESLSKRNEAIKQKHKQLEDLSAKHKIENKTLYDNNFIKGLFIYLKN